MSTMKDTTEVCIEAVHEVGEKHALPLEASGTQDDVLNMARMGKTQELRVGL